MKVYIERFDKTVPLVLLDQWNWDQIVQIFYFIKVQLFLLFSGRIIGITLWLQRFLGFMGVKRFQGTIYSELFLLLLIPLWWHLSREKRNPTYRNEIVIRQEHGVHASTTLAAIGYFFSSSFNINSGMIRTFLRQVYGAQENQSREEYPKWIKGFNLILIKPHRLEGH